MNSKVLKSILKTLTVTVVAFLFMAAAPLAVSAAPAVTSLSMDRTTIAPGQNITFTIRATAQTNFVFAVVDGVRTQGTRSGNNWTVTVSPTRTSTVNIFANSVNNETNAASISVPVTVTGAAVATTPNPAVTIPAAPANLGPIAIASVTETPALAAGQVQLTIVTGRETNEVWVNFDRANNVRATGRFARGTMLSQGAHYRTWVVNFTPASWTEQQVEVGSNRTYNWPGAATRLYTLTLTQPFVRVANPSIQNTTVTNRTVAPGSNATITIRTNADVENVWVRNVDGTEFNATRTSTTATQRNWSVTFNPVRTGNVTIFANSDRTETGAVTRTENITVGNVTTQIVGTPTAHWLAGQNNQLRINVTTNDQANSVWATLPDGQRVQLSRQNSGTGNRTWQADTWTTFGHGGHHDPITGQWIPAGGTWNITIHASNQTGTNAPSDTSRNITTGWQGGHQTGNLGVVYSISPSAHQHIARGSSVTFSVRARGTDLQLSVQEPGHFSATRSVQQNHGDGTITWSVTVHALPGG
ncbi:MAG: hypothetical protein FWF81_10200, partial [Defluviitaleaceae bacterium]|nr:hypothetical protein [Defluviitaleaceae bacterium]